MDGAGAASDPTAAFSGAWGGCHAVNINEFVQAIQEQHEPSIGAQEARKAVQLLNDIYRAARVGPWAPAASAHA